MNAQQEGLLLKARRSIEAAKALLERGDTDFSVSRSYYAMFYLAEALLLQNDLTFSSHGAVVSALGRDFAATGIIPKRIHQYLHRAYEARQIGDYHIANEIAGDVAQAHIVRAEEFLATVQAYLKQNPQDPPETR